MRKPQSGAELIRQALANAQTPEERKTAEDAAATVAREITAYLHRHWDEQGTGASREDPIAGACQFVIRELYAAATGIDITALGLGPSLPSKETPFEKELEVMRQRSAEIVSKNLPPNPSSVRRRIHGPCAEYSVVGRPLYVDVCRAGRASRSRR